MTEQLPLPESIRVATVDDVDAIMTLLRMMHAESGLCSLNEGKTREHVTNIARSGTALVAQEGEGVVGTIGFFFTQPFYSDDYILQDTWMFVHPDHRRSTHAKMLLTCLDTIGKRLGMKVFAGVMGEHDIEAKARLFGRIMKPIGYGFVGGAA